MAFAPCVGAAAILHAGESGPSKASTLLGARPLVAVGLVFYSLYLWHWPLLVFARYWAIRPLTTLETLGAVALAAVIAVVSYRCVERPVRRAELRSKPVLLAGAFAAMAGVAGVGYWLAVTDGATGRIPPTLKPVVAAASQLTLAEGVCDEANSESDVAGSVECTVGGPTLGPPTFAVWGDSHARALAPAVRDAAKATGRRGLLVASSGCAPLSEVSRTSVRGATSFDCPAVASRASELLASHATLRDVFLVGRWALYAEGVRYLSEPGGPVVLHDAAEPHGSIARNIEVFERGLDRSLSLLRKQPQLRVWLLSDVPEVGWDVPSVLFRIGVTGRLFEIAPDRSAHLRRQDKALRTLTRLSSKYQAPLLRLDDALCGSTRCAVARDGIPLYADDDHLSLEGAKLIVPILSDALRAP